MRLPWVVGAVCWGIFAKVDVDGQQICYSIGFLFKLRASVSARIKICGITRPQDAHQAASLGADAIGLVFYPPSPRAVTVAQAQAIAAVLPPFVQLVALFVDASESAIQSVLSHVPVSLLQFHGEESPQACQRWQRPYIKAIRMRPGTEVESLAARYAGASGILLDSYDPLQPGGTGQVFDWQRVPDSLRQRVILAGGLTPDNVRQALAQVRPAAVDVSGGVEAAKGIKQAEKMQAFINEVDGFEY